MQDPIISLYQLAACHIGALTSTQVAVAGTHDIRVARLEGL